MAPQELALIQKSGAKLDLKKLAESTASVFKLLQPWCLSENLLRSSTVFGPIRTQAYEYAKAVDFSITAAQNGFDFCEDILAYAEDFDVTDEAVRQEALQDLWELAKQGSENAHRASWSFRGTRQTVSKLLQDARSKRGSVRDQKNWKKLDEFERGIPTLEVFYGHLTLYISFWNAIDMDQNTQKTRHAALVENFDVIRQQGVLNTWKQLREQYLEYTCIVQSIQDTYPEFWKLVKQQP